MNQVDVARNAHTSVDRYQQWLGLNLKSSPISLYKPTAQILHSAGSTSEELNQKPLETIERSIPGRLWEEWGEHDLLMQELEVGWVPGEKWDKIPLAQHHGDVAGRTPTHIQALKVAKTRGYYVPEKYLLEPSDISFSEYIAYRTAHELILNHCYYLGYNLHLSEWKKQVIFFTGQFIVPDGFKKEKTPYVIDQLWVIRNSQKQVRLIGLEIDGEHHFHSEEKIRKDRDRDIRLAAMGYEMYHVAGWWCRIDPLRVIHEFLQVSGIFPDAVPNLIGRYWNSINDYKCGICNQPIVRHEDNWFEQIHYRGFATIAHPLCAESYYDSLY